MKRIILLLLLLPIESAAVLEFNETDYIRLRPAAYEPDNDSLTYFFEPPLSRQGDWQTTYGDAGTYHTKVMVSDGRLLSTINVTLVIHKKNEVPVIRSKTPLSSDLFLRDGDSLFFRIDATDVNKDTLSIEWRLDGKYIGVGNYYTYATDYYSGGDHEIPVSLFDGKNTIRESWRVEVDDFDRSSLLNSFSNVTVNETDTIILQLPDFERYLLRATISPPFQDSDRWETNYGDAGLYPIRIFVSDERNFTAEKIFWIDVQNLDRPPRLAQSRFNLREGEEYSLAIFGEDPDKEDVRITFAGLPAGAEWNGTYLIWKPSYDLVTPQNVVDEIGKRLLTLNREFPISANLISNLSSVRQEIILRIFHVNRRPVLNPIKPLQIAEGEETVISLSATDPDFDALSYTFSGIIPRNNYRIGYDMAGVHQVKATVSDGFLTDSKWVQVTITNTNRPPVLKGIPSAETSEGKEVRISLDAIDPDGDTLSYSVSPMPPESYFDENTFVWMPDLDTVASDSQISMTFAVSDGNASSAQNVSIRVKNVNRPQQLLHASQDQRAYSTFENVYFDVDAIDSDGDLLNYSWRTSLLGSIEANDTLIINYESPGEKTVAVQISDGKSVISKRWTVSISSPPTVRFYYPGQVSQQPSSLVSGKNTAQAPLVVEEIAPSIVKEPEEKVYKFTTYTI